MNIQLINRLLKQPFPALSALSFAALMGAVFFMPLHQAQALIPTFNANIITVGLGLLSGLILLSKAQWRPLYFPAIALLPILFSLLLALQIALGLVAYWQQQLLVILSLLWAACLMVVGAQLRRYINLQEIAPVLASVIVASATLFALINIAMHVALHQTITQLIATPVGSQPFFIGSQLCVITAMVYLWLSGNLSKMLGLIIGLILITHAHIAGHISYIVQISQWPNIAYYLGLIKQSWVIFTSNPLMGMGWGQYAWQDLQQANQFSQHTGMVKHPSNLIMQLLAETGVIGFGIVLISLGLWVVNLKQKDTNQLIAPNIIKTQHSAQAWLLTSLIILSTSALFYNGLSYLPVLGLLALILGILDTRIFKAYFNLGPLFVGAFGLLAIVNIIQINNQYNTLQQWYSQTQFKTFNQAQTGPMLETLGALKHRTLLTPYVDTAIVRALPNHPRLVADKLMLNTQLIQQSPNEQEAYAQAQLLALNGNIAQAKQQLQLAMIRHPEGLYTFSVDLLKAQNPQVLPLLQMIVKHNLQSIEAEKKNAIEQKNIPKPTGKTPIKTRDSVRINL